MAIGAAASRPAQAAAGRRETGATPPINWGRAPTRSLLSAQGRVRAASPCRWTTRNPDGAKIQLAVSRIKHTVPDEQVPGRHAGQPGRAGRLRAGAVGDRLAGARTAPATAYDWIGFDPRGVGASKPALSCDSDYAGYNRPPYVPSTPAIETAWLQRAEGYAKACAQGRRRAARPPEDPATPSGTWTASGRRWAPTQINFYGFSYGTYLGQVYATLYPDRVRRMVLDGNVDPTRVWYDSNLDQDLAFDRNIKIYFGWIAKYDSVYHLGTTADGGARSCYYAEQAQAGREAGRRGDRPGRADRRLPAGRLLRLRLGGRRATRSAPGSPSTTRPRSRRSTTRTTRRTAGADNGYAIYLAVQCTDAQWPTSWTKWQRGQLGDAPPGAVRDLGQRLVQRALPDLAGHGRRAGHGRPARPCRRSCCSARRSTRPPRSRGSLEVRKRFPQVVADRGRRRDHARRLAVRQQVRRRRGRRLPGHRRTARSGCKGDRSDKQCAPLPQPNPTKPRRRSGPPPSRPGWCCGGP